MDNLIGINEITDAMAFLDDLYTAVTFEEGTLSGGNSEQLYEGGTAVQGLRETRISLGHPYHRLTRLTPKLFTALGIELDPLLKEQRKRYEYYYMSMATSLSPKRGAAFQRVECELQFGPAGMQAPIVESIFPQTRWHTVLEWGGELNLALNGQLEWEIGLSNDEILAEVLQLSGVPNAKIKTANAMKAHILVPDYSFKMGRVETSATGVGNTYCRWRIEDPQLQETETADFIVVFKVPKGITTIELTGILTADTKLAWLTGHLNSIFGDLARRFQALWQPEARLPIGVQEKWTVTLPD